MPTYNFEDGLVPAGFLNSTDHPWAAATDFSFAGSYSLKSGCAGVASGWSQLTLLGNFSAGDVKFQRRYDTEASFDKFVFRIDGVVQTGYPKSGSGTTFAEDTFTLTAGIHCLEWVYAKEAGTNIGGDAVWIDNLVVPDFSAITNTIESFEGGALPSGWTNDATRPWTFITTALRRLAGSYAARSASGGANNTSDISRTITTVAGKMFFFYQIRSESGFDFGKFFIDGVEQTDATVSSHYNSDLTGELAGMRYRGYDVSAASHTFAWKYSKDGSGDVSDDAYFIDYVCFPVVGQDPPPTPPGYSYSNLGSRRNRPGRGPYSFGRYFRPSVEMWSLPIFSVSKAIAALLEALSPATQSRAANIESLASVVQARAAVFESLARAAGTCILSIEALAFIAAVKAPNIEALSPASNARAAHLEALGDARTTKQINIEALGTATVSATAVIRLESLGDVRQSRIENIESLSALAAPFTLRLESLGLISKSSTGVIEAVASVSDSSVVNIEALAAASAVAGSATLSVEALKSIANQAQVPVEALLGNGLNFIFNVVNRTVYFQIRYRADAKFTSTRDTDVNF